MVLKNSDNNQSRSKIHNTIINLAASALNAKVAQISDEDALFSTNKAFDSFALLELVLSLEEAFHIGIPDEDLDPDIFFSINTITTYICDKLGREG